MSGIGGSLEEAIAQKLRFNEIKKPQQITAALEYFNSIINEKVKSSPVEFKGLLNLLSKRQKEDQDKSIAKYFLTHEMTLKLFFKNNMQRYDRFEYQSLIEKLKGESADKKIKISAELRHNFEVYRPFNTKPYQEMLESNPLELELRRTGTIKTTPQKNMQDLAEKQKDLRQRIVLIQKNIQNLLRQNKTPEDLTAHIDKAINNFVPALQIKYNKEAIHELKDLLLGNAEYAAEQIFESLNLSYSRVNAFLDNLEKMLGAENNV